MTAKLPEVATAKALMTEAMTWSVMKWLREKKKVRKAADQANAALDQLGEKTKEAWPEDFKVAYVSLDGSASKTPANGKKAPSIFADSDHWSVVKKVKEADDEAYRARMTAEETFDEAERQLSTRLAREGCEKAIRAWDLKEKAISKAEAIISAKQVTG